MNKAKRAAVIAGNWKMNMTPSAAVEAVKKTAELTKDADCGVVLCVQSRSADCFRIRCAEVRPV